MKSFILLYLISFSIHSNDIPIYDPIVGTTGEFFKRLYSKATDSLERVKVFGLRFAGNIALDNYIRDLPVSEKVKEEVLEKIKDPEYELKLYYFISFMKEQYDLSSEDVTYFNDYIKNKFTEDQIPGLKHSLFDWENDNNSKSNTFKFDNETIAIGVELFHTLFVKSKTALDEKFIPEKYTPLSPENKDDLEVVKRTLPFVIKFLQKIESILDEGDIKDMLGHIIEDGTAQDPFKIKNNKAIAATITLIDFIKMNLLKNYRMFAYKDSREKALRTFLRHNIDQEIQSENDGPVLNVLKALSQRRYAVHITVDGLQGSLLRSLSNGNENTFKKQVQFNHKNKEMFAPSNSNAKISDFEFQMDFLDYYIDNPIFKSDEYYLPFFKYLFRVHEKNIARQGISTTPTISVRNLPIVKTGANVAGEMSTGIPNFHFVDRKKDRAYYFFGNDALQLDQLTSENNLKTMFERLKYFKTLNCSAQYDWDSKFSYDPFVSLGVGEKMRDFGEFLCLKNLKERSRNEINLRSLRKELIDHIILYKKKGAVRKFINKPYFSLRYKNLVDEIIRLEENALPEYTSIYIPWPDHFAHFKGPFSDEIISPTGELNRLDYWLKEITNVYIRSGVFDNTLFAMAGDHGLASIFYYLNPEIVVFEELQKELGREVIIKKISSDEGEGPKLTNNFDPPTNKGIDVIVASTAGGNFMIDLFNGQEKEWPRQPLYGELLNWKTISPGDPINIVSYIAKKLESTLEYLAVRESKSSLESAEIRLVSHRNGKRIDEIIKRHGNKIFYHSVNNDNDPELLQIKTLNPYKDKPSEDELFIWRELIKECLANANEEDDQTWCTEEQWREISYYTPKPDSVVQISHLYDLDNPGTINLFPKSGIGYNTLVPGRHAGEHFHEKDAFVGFWGKNIVRKTQLRSAVNGSIAPTIFEYLTLEKVQVGKNGWGFPSLLD
ncbi:MAG: alkaline phosphatase family protein [Halobacteriovoraceae bacterium]|nr:alkaline phosphatase family protein [Halobacteriovoraceae bacterium]